MDQEAILALLWAGFMYRQILVIAGYMEVSGKPVYRVSMFPLPG
ncbi:hypothetical protein [Photorhabdus sp. CRCIA-P01]|nr:hypothetical protein [Photorhabdus sp. CRCIA-P01]